MKDNGSEKMSNTLAYLFIRCIKNLFLSEPLIRNCGGNTWQPLDMIKIVENHNLSFCYNIILVYKITMQDDDIEKGSNALAY